MKFSGDYHTHSCHSDGRATIEEMVEAAKKKNLQEIAITDHGPRNIGSGVKNGKQYLNIKKEVAEINAKNENIKVLVGAEANVLGYEGKIDLEKDIIKELDLLLVGLHPYVFPASLQLVLENQMIKLLKGQREKVTNNNTKALIECITRNNCLAITHPGLKMPVDYKELAKACVKTDTALEINTGHRFPSVEEVAKAAKTGVNFIINSDAHFTESVGNFTYGAYVVEKAGLPLERVLNSIKLDNK